MLQGMQFVVYYATDLQQAKKWYGEVLGPCTCIEPNEVIATAR